MAACTCTRYIVTKYTKIEYKIQKLRAVTLQNMATCTYYTTMIHVCVHIVKWNLDYPPLTESVLKAYNTNLAGCSSPLTSREWKSSVHIS